MIRLYLCTGFAPFEVPKRGETGAKMAMSRKESVIQTRVHVIWPLNADRGEGEGEIPQQLGISSSTTHSTTLQYHIVQAT